MGGWEISVVMFQFHVTVNEGDVEWPEKGIADEGFSAGTGVPSLVIIGDSPGPRCTHYRREEAMQTMEETIICKIGLLQQRG